MAIGCSAGPALQSLILRFGSYSTDACDPVAPDICELAVALRPQILEAISEGLRCLDPNSPIQIGDESYSPSAYFKILQDLLALTYTVCETEARSEGPKVVVSGPRLCGECR